MEFLEISNRRVATLAVLHIFEQDCKLFICTTKSS